jgi:hypothetical protein
VIQASSPRVMRRKRRAPHQASGRPYGGASARLRREHRTSLALLWSGHDLHQNQPITPVIESEIRRDTGSFGALDGNAIMAKEGRNCICTTVA